MAAICSPIGSKHYLGGKCCHELLIVKIGEWVGRFGYFIFDKAWPR
ncbi:hypothetical protein A8U91_04695 [Halomonas elongata]|uniref:Uncharacterized protein n=1 Tax=Halomonas elongata TaxID=2746 RepID=A0A1B8P032_HALEL|nr:hypothetical protein A8U91_04695 [Halomonas elongata]